ncbi:uncharacterized protein LOC113124556 isoform X2 [Mastacembelus armatus]|uniref:uncharacterized protein LOC113124556 isoform X2 n=1 Tax=Mastacembelus armatus TaxID=205130 RepID=UPI000E461A98|nr:uncharacterized protein LOC113124556 isoform X2 [Mastacembelus armatus]
MKSGNKYLLLYIIFITSVVVKSLDPINYEWQQIFNSHESCDSKWISFNAEGLRADVESKLIGQHIASSIILKAVEGFMSDTNPQKPLVLSLHGPSGTGKNFVSKLIAGNIYKEGMDSSFVHIFISTYHFPHQGHVDLYKTQLQQWIKDKITHCERSMFIFDEMDKMHPGLTDSIMPYLGYHNKLDGVSYRKAIFIFLSNAGGEIITETALKFWKEGKDREEIELKDLETLISATAFNNNNSGFWHSSLIDRHLVDFFVPFLPLQYGHVIICAMATMKARGQKPDQNKAHKLAKDLEYFPKFWEVFSARGCKTVEARLEFYMMSTSDGNCSVTMSTSNKYNALKQMNKESKSSVVVKSVDPINYEWQQIFNSHESCDSKWISFNAEGLRADLESKLIGQHIASSIILKAVEGFMSDTNPQKPLVLSLHGPSGTGKNFVSKLIAGNIYKEGMDSSFVHIFISTYHFPHQGHVDLYKTQLQQWIKDKITHCEHSMFIFDEMDKCPPGLMDSIMPYLGYHNKLDGVSYRKAIFIFLSNAGGEIITETALKFWKEGKDREEIELKDLETLISATAFNNNNSGFWHSSLIDRNLVDFFVPFLPLQYGHVIICAMATMKARGQKPDQNKAHKLAKDLEYFPKFWEVFSARGCKTVEARLEFYMMSTSDGNCSVTMSTSNKYNALKQMNKESKSSVVVKSLDPINYEWQQIFNSHESCDSKWISFNAEGLRADVESKLIGQHIASSIILKAVEGFMSDDNPQKPLVLSLHGPSGTGKNFVSKLIAGNIYKKGMDSSFVKVFTSTFHFPHKENIDRYKTQLQQWIKDKITHCERSMFIFDEMDKMHPGLTDSIMPYLGYHNKLDGVSYRKAIFIFLSNAGGEIITETALKFWKEGKDREEIELKDLETLISATAFNNNNSGFWHSSLIDRHLVDFFVPFLPLEYRHVVICAIAAMKARGQKPDQNKAIKLAEDLDFFPKFERAFSVRGCKTVEARLEFYT